MCVDCVLASPRIAQVDLGDEPPSEVVLSASIERRRPAISVALPPSGAIGENPDDLLSLSEL
jgi:hypothetical protein